MKVKSTSWHYRLWKVGRARRSEPRDLCRYFWHLVLIKLLFPAILAGLILLALGTLLWLVWGHPVESALTVVGGLLIAGAVVGLIVLIGRLYDRRLERASLPQPVKEPREPSVLWAYLGARKRKLCPLIEVVNEDASPEGGEA